MTHRTIAFTIAAALVSLAMGACRSPSPAPLPRPLDREPAVTTRAPALPVGVVHAFFTLDTGGDQLGGSSKEAGLVVVVRYADREARQTIATCQEPALGSALGGGEGALLEVAYCGGEYHLEARADDVAVTREGAVVARIAVPAGSTPATRPPEAP